MDIASFLYGMYYAGKLPSRAEIGEISQYLRKSGFVSGKQQEIEKRVAEKMAEMHQAIHPKEELKEGGHVDNH